MLRIGYYNIYSHQEKSVITTVIPSTEDSCLLTVICNGVLLVISCDRMLIVLYIAVIRIIYCKTHNSILFPHESSQ